MKIEPRAVKDDGRAVRKTLFLNPVTISKQKKNKIKTTRVHTATAYCSPGAFPKYTASATP